MCASRAASQVSEHRGCWNARNAQGSWPENMHSLSWTNIDVGKPWKKKIMCRSFCMGFPMSFPHLLSMLVYSSVEWRPSPTTHVVFMSVKGRVGGTDLALIRGTTPKMKPISRMVNCDRLARWWAFNSNRVKNGTKTARHVWGLSLCQNLGISSCCIVLCCKKKRLSFSHGILGTWIKMDKGLISWPLMGRLMWFFSSLPGSSNGVLRGKTPLFYWGNHLFLWDIETLTLTC